MESRMSLRRCAALAVLLVANLPFAAGAIPSTAEATAGIEFTSTKQFSPGGSGRLQGIASSLGGTPTWTVAGFAPAPSTAGDYADTGWFTKAIGGSYGLNGVSLGTLVAQGQPRAESNSHLLVASANQSHGTAHAKVTINRRAWSRVDDPIFFDNLSLMDSWSWDMWFDVDLDIEEGSAEVGGEVKSTMPEAPTWFGFGGVIAPIAGTPQVTLTFSSDDSLGLNDSAILNQMIANTHVDGAHVWMDRVTVVVQPQITGSMELTYKVESATAAVPEPSVVALITIAGSMLVASCRRRAKSEARR